MINIFMLEKLGQGLNRFIFFKINRIIHCPPEILSVNHTD